MIRPAKLLPFAILLGGCGLSVAVNDAGNPEQPADAPVDPAMDTPTEPPMDIPVDVPMDTPIDTTMDASCVSSCASAPDGTACSGGTCAAGVCSAPAGSYTVLRATSAPVIDGDPSEFAGAPVMRLTNASGNVGSYRMLWDDTALYVAAFVQDSQIDAAFTARDATLWLDDTIELFFDTLHDRSAAPDADDRKAFVNVLNTQRDERAFDATFDMVFQSAVQVMGTVNNDADTDTSYAIELSIPWAQFQVPVPVDGTTWGFDVSMDDLDGTATTQTTWVNSTGGDPNDPPGYGQAVFSLATSGTPGSCPTDGGFDAPADVPADTPADVPADTPADVPADAPCRTVADCTTNLWCGTVDNLCGSTIDCGTCTAPATCNVATHRCETPGATNIRTVFIILEENHNWSDMTPSNAPYIYGTLLPMGAHCENYWNPMMSSLHPSLPNYLWLEAGDNFGILDDANPPSHHESTRNHLVNLLNNAGISWRAYQEDIPGTNCPLDYVAGYAPKHDPFVYFDDVTSTGAPTDLTNPNDPASAYCIAHIRPYSELAADLAAGTVARYNFITPNQCNDMHDCSIQTGDTWLSNQIPMILSSSAYTTGGAIFITWDEAYGNPDGMIVLSPFAKTNYSNTILYDHSSTLRTFQDIFGVFPYLGGAATATNLADLFTVFP